jgi:hypothetical protein
MKPVHAHKHKLCGLLMDLHSESASSYSGRKKSKKIPIDTQPRNLYSSPIVRHASQANMTSLSPQFPASRGRRTPSFLHPVNFQKQKNFLIDA